MAIWLGDIYGRYVSGRLGRGPVADLKTKRKAVGRIGWGGCRRRSRASSPGEPGSLVPGSCHGAWAARAPWRFGVPDARPRPSATGRRESRYCGGHTVERHTRHLALSGGQKVSVPLKCPKNKMHPASSQQPSAHRSELSHADRPGGRDPRHRRTAGGRTPRQATRRPPGRGPVPQRPAAAPTRPARRGPAAPRPATDAALDPPIPCAPARRGHRHPWRRTASPSSARAPHAVGHQRIPRRAPRHPDPGVRRLGGLLI